MNEKDEVQDNLNKRCVVKIYIGQNGLPTWTWQGLSGEQVERLFLDCYHNQVRYNIEKAIKEKDKPKIFKPNINDVIMTNKR